MCNFEDSDLLCAELSKILATLPADAEVTDCRELHSKRPVASSRKELPAVVFLVLGSKRLTNIRPQLEALIANWAGCSLIGVFGHLETSDRYELLRLGLSEFVTTPLRANEVVARVAWQLERLKPPTRAINQLKEKVGLKQIIGESPALRRLVEKIPLMARCSATVLVTGETGTGKEICARAVHYLSPRSGRAFVAINCGAIPVELVENELFGHEPGAFTSATTKHTGLLVEADGGTLFLDEIEALPLAAQVKLLRFLQDREYRPLGSSKSRCADVRVIAASNGVIEDAVRSGRFRPDLYYRLNVLSLALPPLRERREDIPLLARHFMEKYAGESGRVIREVAADAIQKLLGYDWPGNVRELENVIERAVLMNESGHLEANEMVLRHPEIRQTTASASFRALKRRAIEEFEKSYLREMMRQSEGNISAAARAAQKDRRAFWELLRKHHLLSRPDQLPLDHPE